MICKPVCFFVWMNVPQKRDFYMDLTQRIQIGMQIVSPFMNWYAWCKSLWNLILGHCC